MRLCLGAILLMLASLPLQAQSTAADPQLLWPLLQERLAAADTAAGDGDAAALERLQARQALQALPEVRSRDRAFATGIAELRVGTAEAAVKAAKVVRMRIVLLVVIWCFSCADSIAGAIGLPNPGTVQ